MNPFWNAVRRGSKMTRHIFWKWIQIPLALATVAGIIALPFGLSYVDNQIVKTLAWVFLLMVIFIAAICVGLTPYWGQGEINKEQMVGYGKRLAEYEKYSRDLERELKKRGWDGKAGLS